MTKFSLALLFLTVLSGQAWSKRVQMVYLGRNYTLIVPDSKQKVPKPLVVLLHGCKQTPAIMLEGTKLEKEALKNDFMILVPEQPYFANTHYCWNWFMGIQQQRIPTNEMGQVVSAIDVVGLQYPINKEKVFVTGMSAGGVMAHNLTACYPNVFAASAIHSGLNYKIAESITESETVLTSHNQKSASYLGQKMYQCARNVPDTNKLSRVLIIHGADDNMVPELHASLISQSQAVWRDFMDDGKKNRSNIGKSSVRRQRYPNGYEAEQTDTQYKDFFERRIMMKGLGHAWGGGKAVSQYFDPNAPSSTQIILDFFGLTK
jgi:poly(hydroxyalkanoate) depolymerase family esterase